MYLDFKHAIERLGLDTIRDRYGNLFHMYQKITAENPYEVPMRIYPAAHWEPTTARVAGLVQDGSGRPIFGAHVVAASVAF